MNTITCSPALLKVAHREQPIPINENKHGEAIDIWDEKSLQTHSEHDLFLAFINSHFHDLNEVPPLSEEHLQNFRSILKECLTVNVKTENSMYSIENGCSVAKFIEAIQDNKFDRFTSFDFQHMHDIWTEIFGSSAYNLITVGWYYLFLQKIGIDQEKLSHYLVQSVLFQFFWRTELPNYEKNDSKFMQINDLDVRTKAKVYSKRQLMFLQKRVNRYIKSLLPNSVTIHSRKIQFSKKFAIANQQSCFAIHTFKSGIKEVDWLITGEKAIKPLVESDGLAIPVTLITQIEEGVTITPITYAQHLNVAQTVAMRMAKVMIIHNSYEKSHTAFWAYLAYQTDEMRSHPPEVERGVDQEIELWKTALLHAAFASEVIYNWGEELVALFYGRELTSNELLQDKLFKIRFQYKNTSPAALKKLKNTFYDRFSSLSFEDKTKVSQSLLVELKKRIEDHLAERLPQLLLLIIQFGAVLIKTSHQELFYLIAESVLSDYRPKVDEKLNEYDSRYSSMLRLLMNSLKEKNLPVDMLIATFQVSALIDSALPKSDPQHCVYKTHLTQHQDIYCLQKVCRPFGKLPYYKHSVLLPLIRDPKPLLVWLESAQSISIQNAFWSLFYSMLLNDSISLDAVSSLAFHIQDSSLAKSLKIVIAEFDEAKNLSVQALVVWLKSLLYLILPEQDHANNVLLAFPTICQNRWLGNNRLYTQKCCKFFYALLDKIISEKKIVNPHYWTHYSLEELLYKYPLFMVELIPTLKIPLLEQYKSKMNELEKEVAVLYKSHPTICVRSLEWLAPSKALATKLIEQSISFTEISEYVHNSILESSLTENDSIQLIELLIERQDSLFSIEYERILYDFWQQKHPVLPVKVKSNLLSTLIKTILKHNNPLKSSSLWLNFYVNKTISLRDSSYDESFINILKALYDLGTEYANETATMLIKLSPIDKQWAPHLAKQMHTWIQNLTDNEEVLKRLGPKEANQHKWHTTRDKLFSAIQAEDWHLCSSLLRTLFTYSSIQQHNHISADLFHYTLQAIAYCDHSKVTACFFDVCTGNAVLDQLNTYPAMKLEILQFMKEFTSNSKQAWIIIEILKTFTFSSPELVRIHYASIQNQITQLEAVKKWINDSIVSIGSIIKACISNELYWRLYTEVLDLPKEKNTLWLETKDQILICSDETLIWINQLLIRQRKAENGVRNLGDREPYITCLLQRLLQKTTLAPHAKYWIDCYLGTSTRNIKFPDPLFKSFKLLVNTFPDQIEELIEKLKELHYSPTISTLSLSQGSHPITIDDLEKIALNTFCKKGQWQHYLNRIHRTCHLTTKVKAIEELIARCLNEKIVLDKHIAKSVIQFAFTRNELDPSSLFTFVDLQSIIQHDDEIAQLIFLNLCKYVSSNAFLEKSHVDVPLWTKRLRHCMHYVGISSAYLMLFENKKLLDALSRYDSEGGILTLIYKGLMKLPCQQVIAGIKKHDSPNVEIMFNAFKPILHHFLITQPSAAMVIFCTEAVIEGYIHSITLLELENLVISSLVSNMKDHFSQNTQLIKTVEKMFYVKCIISSHNPLKMIDILSQIPHDGMKRLRDMYLKLWLKLIDDGIQKNEIRDFDLEVALTGVIRILTKEFPNVMSEISFGRLFSIIRTNYNNPTIKIKGAVIDALEALFKDRNIKLNRPLSINEYQDGCRVAMSTFQFPFTLGPEFVNDMLQNQEFNKLKRMFFNNISNTYLTYKNLDLFNNKVLILFKMYYKLFCEYSNYVLNNSQKYNSQFYDKLCDIYTYLCCKVEKHHRMDVFDFRTKACVLSSTPEGKQKYNSIPAAINSIEGKRIIQQNQNCARMDAKLKKFIELGEDYNSTFVLTEWVIELITRGLAHRAIYLESLQFELNGFLFNFRKNPQCDFHDILDKLTRILDAMVFKNIEVSNETKKRLDFISFIKIEFKLIDIIMQFLQVMINKTSYEIDEFDPVVKARYTFSIHSPPIVKVLFKAWDTLEKLANCEHSHELLELGDMLPQYLCISLSKFPETNLLQIIRVWRDVLKNCTKSYLQEIEKHPSEFLPLKYTLSKLLVFIGSGTISYLIKDRERLTTVKQLIKNIGELLVLKYGEDMTTAVLNEGGEYCRVIDRILPKLTQETLNNAISENPPGEMRFRVKSTKENVEALKNVVVNGKKAGEEFLSLLNALPEEVFKEIGDARKANESVDKSSD